MRTWKLIFSFLLMTLLGAELGAAAYYQLHFKTLVSAPRAGREKFGKYWNNPEVRKCPEKEIWAPLPHLGYGRSVVLTDLCAGGTDLANNVGLIGPDFPDQKDPALFTVLLTGGSVAERFGLQKVNHTVYLEHLLNERFLPPKGERFRVLIAANGDYRQPQNLISFLLFHDVVDAVIDLSGFNENSVYEDTNRLEKTSGLFWELFQTEKIGMLKSQARKIVAAMESGPCQYSFSCVLLTEWRLQGMMKEITEKKSFLPQMRMQKYSSRMTGDEASRLRLSKHKSYYRITQGICEKLHYHCSFFLQPAPMFRKTLTPFEKAQLPAPLPLKWANYQNLVRELETLKSELPIHSLLGIYEKESGTIYDDWIHIQAEQGKISRGYELLAESMIREIRIDWKLRPR